jgi:hypothetical protein
MRHLKACWDIPKSGKADVAMPQGFEKYAATDAQALQMGKLALRLR